MQITLAEASMNEVANAVSCAKSRYFSCTTSVAVWVCPVMLPETTRTAPYSPRDRARLSTTP